MGSDEERALRKLEYLGMGRCPQDEKPGVIADIREGLAKARWDQVDIDRQIELEEARSNVGRGSG